MGVWRLSSGLVALAVFTLGAGDALAGTGNVTGRILDRNTSAPIAGVKVETNPPSQTACTNGNGQYTITGLQASVSYTVMVGKVGYASDKVTIIARSDVTVQADMGLRADPKVEFPAACIPAPLPPAVYGASIGGQVIFWGKDPTLAIPPPNLAEPMDVRDLLVWNSVSGLVRDAEVYTTPGSKLVKTDDLGFYFINPLASGVSYTVFVRKSGYLPFQPNGLVIGSRATPFHADLVLERQNSTPTISVLNGNGYVDVTLQTITPYGEILYGYGNGNLVNTTDWLYSSPLFVTRSELVKAQTLGPWGKPSEVASRLVSVPAASIRASAQIYIRSAEVTEINPADRMKWDNYAPGYATRPDPYATVDLWEGNRWLRRYQSPVRANALVPYWNGNTGITVSAGSRVKISVYDMDPSGSQTLGDITVDIENLDLNRGYKIVGAFGSVMKLILVFR